MRYLKAFFDISSQQLFNFSAYKCKYFLTSQNIEIIFTHVLFINDLIKEYKKPAIEKDEGDYVFYCSSAYSCSTNILLFFQFDVVAEIVSSISLYKNY